MRPLPAAAVAMWFLTILAGAWSLDRLDPSLTSLGVLVQARFWLTFLLLIVTIIVTVTDQADTPRLEAPEWWMGGVLALHVLLMASTAWTISPDFTLGTSFPDAALIVLLMLATAATFRLSGSPGIHALMHVAFWVALLYMGGGISERWWEYGRMAAFGGGANVFARVMGMGGLAATYLWATSGRVRWLAALPLFAYGAIMSGSRGGLLAIAVAATLYVLKAGRNTRFRLRDAGTLVLGGLVIVVVWGGKLLDLWQYRFIELTFESGYGSSRDVIFRLALGMFREHPITGAGLDAFQFISGWGYPHNIVLQLAAEVGVLGLVLGATLIVIPLRAFLTSRDDRVHAAGAMFVLYLVANMFSGGVYDWRFLWAFGYLTLLSAHVARPGPRPT